MVLFTGSCNPDSINVNADYLVNKVLVLSRKAAARDGNRSRWGVGYRLAPDDVGCCPENCCDVVRICESPQQHEFLWRDEVPSKATFGDLTDDVSLDVARISYTRPRGANGGEKFLDAICVVLLLLRIGFSLIQSQRRLDVYVCLKETDEGEVHVDPITVQKRRQDAITCIFVGLGFGFYTICERLDLVICCLLAHLDLSLLTGNMTATADRIAPVSRSGVPRVLKISGHSVLGARAINVHPANIAPKQSPRRLVIKRRTSIKVAFNSAPSVVQLNVQVRHCQKQEVIGDPEL